MLVHFQMSAPLEWVQRADEAARVLKMTRSGLIRVAVLEFIENKIPSITTDKTEAVSNG